MQGANIWNMITSYYISSPVWMVLSIVAIIYIVICSDKATRKKLMLCIVFSVLCILNEVSYHILTKFFDSASYYRFLWVVPYGMVVAYALTHCVLSIVNEKNTRQAKLLSILLVGLIVSVLYVTQGNYIDRLKSDYPQNKYLVSDDILEIKAALNQERAIGNCEAEPTIACPKNVMMEYQTVDAGCIISTSRIIYLQVREYGADVSELSQVFKDGYLLSTICEDNAQPDVLEAKAAIVRQQIDYMVVNANAGMEEYMESLDFTLAGVTQSYLVYRYNFPWWRKAESQDEIESIKEAISISEDDIIVDIGLEKTYKLIAVNDVHIEAMDDTVNEPYKQTVYDRFYGMFINPFGIRSMDMWNGISSILDSYDANGIVFIGDMIDYNSQTTADLLKAGLNNIDTPYTYVRSDHDLGVWYTDGEVLPETAVEISSQVAELQDVFVNDYGEFYLVGWNNSTSQLSESGLEQMKEIFCSASKENKKIVLALHVPINSVVDDGLEEAARAYDGEGRAKLWGSNCLYQPNETTQEFLAMVMADDSPVAAVFAAHLHFKYTTTLNGEIPEYVLAPSYAGSIGVIEIK